MNVKLYYIFLSGRPLSSFSLSPFYGTTILLTATFYFSCYVEMGNKKNVMVPTRVESAAKGFGMVPTRVESAAKGFGMVPTRVESAAKGFGTVPTRVESASEGSATVSTRVESAMLTVDCVGFDLSAGHRYC